MVFIDIPPLYEPNGKTAVVLRDKNFCGPT
jgi:hypothetical protein